MSHLNLLICNTSNPRETIEISIKGSNEWVKTVCPGVHGFFDAIRETTAVDFTNADQAMQELRDAVAMADQGDSYLGSIVYTEITITEPPAEGTKRL